MLIADRVHPRHHKWDHNGNFGEAELVVAPEDVPKGEYEQQFGYPADIDAVWAAREEYQCS